MTRVLVPTAVVLAVLLLASGIGRATVPQRGSEDAGSARAVAELTGPQRSVVGVPAGFAYRPVVVGGKLLDPQGSCSSPIDLPEAFEDACRAHDLGYDLLRHAAAQGGPLGPWARRAVDEQLARDLSAACAGEGLRCHLLAGLADAAVAANSWRQGWSVPVVEHGPFVREEP
ncbi:hypothetical protein [Actinomycetospora aeridis]|uniref:Phospholipase A2-like protein n=1 Tax=Actinomycetospora aeridis TaxID=3129231 RepID=A0ABU8NDD9_9PSEU